MQLNLELRAALRRYAGTQRGLEEPGRVIGWWSVAQGRKPRHAQRRHGDVGE
jgi:hypothetical protein